jgi:mannose-1-phosphate guanylyltransferase
MKIKTCLITAAGFGTRMGEVGKKIPKPLWPIFNKTLLDLQLNYAKELGVEDIYINIHHQADLIREWAKDKNVNLLEEDEILGSGGCVHNLYKNIRDKSQTILIINSDQFYFFDKAHLNRAKEMMITKKACAHLIGIKVDKHEKYNETVLVDNILSSIEKPQGDVDYITYSGVGLIDLSLLKYREGVSGFFDSVCNYKKDSVLMTTPDKSEYWDFGTKEKYLECMFQVLKEENSEMYKFLKKNDVFSDGVQIVETNEQANEIQLDLHNLILCKNGEVLSLREG